METQKQMKRIFLDNSFQYQHHFPILLVSHFINLYNRQQQNPQKIPMDKLQKQTQNTLFSVTKQVLQSHKTQIRAINDQYSRKVRECVTAKRGSISSCQQQIQHGSDFLIPVKSIQRHDKCMTEAFQVKRKEEDEHLFMKAARRCINELKMDAVKELSLDIEDRYYALTGNRR